MAGTFLDDPNRTAVGLDPIWSGAPDDGPEATGATAGTPGAFTPAGAVAPWDIYELGRQGVKASPATAWTTGQRVMMGNGLPATWTGTAWAGGAAPLEDTEDTEDDELPDSEVAE